MTRHRPGLALVLARAGAGLVLWLPVPAQAQEARRETSLDAAYVARLAGFQVGEMRLSAALEARGPYHVRVTGTYGALGWTGRFEGTAQGVLAGAQASPARYRFLNDGTRLRTLAVSFARGEAVDTAVEPPFDAGERDGRVPVEAAHRVGGVVDPLSALLEGALRAGRAGDPCTGRARVYTGAGRFDVALAPATVTGAEAVCAVSYAPVAGHRPGAAPGLADIRLVFAGPSPPGEPRLPTRVEARTPFGRFVLERVAAPPSPPTPSRTRASAPAPDALRGDGQRAG